MRADSNAATRAARVQIAHVPIAQVDPSPRNPRQTLDEIDELAASIRAYGLLQPIVVRQIRRDRFEVVAGHRRLAALQSLGWTEIPAIVRDSDPSEAYVLTLIENLQRDDLSPREQARALEVLVREREWTTRQVAAAIHRSAAYVSKRLRVFDDSTLAPLVLQNRLSVSAAEELLPLPAAEKRQLAIEAAEAGWEQRQVRARIKGRSVTDPKLLRKLLSQVRELRRTLRMVVPDDLGGTQRQEMARLFLDLSMIAKAPGRKRDVVIPKLPKMRTERANARMKAS